MGRYLEDPALIQAHGHASRELAEARFDVHRINRFMVAHMGLVGESAAV